MSPEMTRYIPESFGLLSLFLLIELFLNLWISASGRCWSCGRNHVDDWMFAVGGTRSVFSICAQRNEINKRWCFLNTYAWIFVIMDLTVVSVDFSKQSNAMADANTISLEERIRNLELQNRQQESCFYGSQEGDTKGVGLGDLPTGRPEVQMMLNLYFNFSFKDKKKVFLRQFVLISDLCSLSLDCF